MYITLLTHWTCFYGGMNIIYLSQAISSEGYITEKVHTEVPLCVSSGYVCTQDVYTLIGWYQQVSTNERAYFLGVYNDSVHG